VGGGAGELVSGPGGIGLGIPKVPNCLNVPGIGLKWDGFFKLSLLFMRKSRCIQDYMILRPNTNNLRNQTAEVQCVRAKKRKGGTGETLTNFSAGLVRSEVPLGFTTQKAVVPGKRHESQKRARYGRTGG